MVIKTKALISQGFRCVSYGAGNGAQTRDLRLGKATLYQLSYSRVNNMYNKPYKIKSQYKNQKKFIFFENFKNGIKHIEN